MTYSQVKEQIQQGNTSSFYIFAGDEHVVQDAYISQIAKCKNQIVRRLDTVSEAMRMRSSGLFGQTYCYVCQDDADFENTEDAWAKVESHFSDSTLIYIITKLDKRSKFYNTFADKILVFDYMAEPVLIKHIRERLNLSVDNCKELIRVCESDYGRILSELTKIQDYCIATDCDIPDKAFLILMTEGTIYRAPTDAIFAWVDALLGGRLQLSFKLFQECLDIGEPPLKLLSVLYQGVRRLLQVQSCQSKDVVETTGLTGWEINLVRDKVGIYDTGELVNALKNIHRIELGIKTGDISEEYAVPYAMIDLLSV